MATKEPQPQAGKVRWDDSQMKSSYANVCNVASSREEVTLLFGTRAPLLASQTQIAVELTDRVIMSPYAAKRLSVLLDSVLKEYESRYGALPDPRAKP